MAKLTISCKEATLFISKKEEGKLSFKQRLQLWLHLGICGFCKLFAKQNKIIINTSKNIDLTINDTLSAGEKKLMIEKLEQ
jgi:hypothetical protein